MTQIYVTYHEVVCHYMTICHDIEGMVLNFGIFEVYTNTFFLRYLRSYWIEIFLCQHVLIWHGCHDIPCWNHLCHDISIYCGSPNVHVITSIYFMLPSNQNLGTLNYHTNMTWVSYIMTTGSDLWGPLMDFEWVLQTNRNATQWPWCNRPSSLDSILGKARIHCSHIQQQFGFCCACTLASVWTVSCLVHVYVLANNLVTVVAWLSFPC